MKVAVVTDDGKSISQHFGRAPYYLVFTIENGEIVATEQRDKVGHRQFSSEPHEHHDDHAGHEAHGHGPEADTKHARMIESILDCEAVIVRGMGQGAYLAMQDAKVRPFVTDIADAEQAVRAYIAGSLDDHTEKLH